MAPSRHATLRDLAPTEKQKVASLIRQVLELRARKPQAAVIAIDDAALRTQQALARENARQVPHIVSSHLR